jgi:hypothetical protein
VSIVSVQPICAFRMLKGKFKNKNKSSSVSKYLFKLEINTSSSRTRFFFSQQLYIEFNILALNTAVSSPNMQNRAGQVSLDSRSYN